MVYYGTCVCVGGDYRVKALSGYQTSFNQSQSWVCLVHDHVPEHGNDVLLCSTLSNISALCNFSLSVPLSTHFNLPEFKGSVDTTCVYGAYLYIDIFTANYAEVRRKKCSSLTLGKTSSVRKTSFYFADKRMFKLICICFML